MSQNQDNEKNTKKSKNLYEVLGIEKTATYEDIKRAYRKLALKYHPDKNLSNDPTTTEKFKEINFANGILSNPQKRKVYDDFGDIGLKLSDQLGDKYISIVMKPWVKFLLCTTSLLTCCCFGCCFCCCCCCGFCCNFCCGTKKFNFDKFDNFDPTKDVNEVVVTSQPVNADNQTFTQQNYGATQA